MKYKNTIWLSVFGAFPVRFLSGCKTVPRKVWRSQPFHRDPSKPVAGRFDYLTG